MQEKQIDKYNFLFTSFQYNITDNGAGAPDAASYVKQSVVNTFVEGNISSVKYIKVVINCQVNTNRNTTPIETQALLKAYTIQINEQQRQFLIDKQNILQFYLQNQGQVAEEFLNKILIPPETILKVYNQFLQDDPISFHIQAQIECFY